MRHLTLLIALLFSLAPLLPAQSPPDGDLRSELRQAMQVRDWATVESVARTMTEKDEKDYEAWFSLGYSLHTRGLYQEALDADIRATPSPELGGIACFNAACACALLGNKDTAFEWLNKAVDRGGIQASMVVTDSDLKSLRDDPRYREVLARIGRGQPKQTSGPPVQAIAQNPNRASSRILYWDGENFVAQFFIDYSPVAWKESYSGMLSSGSLNDKRWRLGGDFWTRLDTNANLVISGVEVPYGIYYLALKPGGEDGDTLILLTAREVQMKRLDAFQADSAGEGIEIPLKSKTLEETAENLLIELVPSEEEGMKSTFVLKFGPRELTADVAVVTGT